MLYAYKNEKRQVNKKFFELRKREYRDGIKMTGDKTGMACVHSRWRYGITRQKYKPFNNDLSPISSQIVPLYHPLYMFYTTSSLCITFMLSSPLFVSKASFLHC